uniref:Uncharacterized protein n=1 Tax=Mus spicilegus TaxID=10103 RepID=A0A8C6GVV4_MUSSI
MLAQAQMRVMLDQLMGTSRRMGSMYLCLTTSICKGVSERPRIRRAEILLVNESNSVMTEYARATFSTVAPKKRCPFWNKNGSWRMLESP